MRCTYFQYHDMHSHSPVYFNSYRELNPQSHHFLLDSPHYHHLQVLEAQLALAVMGGVVGVVVVVVVVAAVALHLILIPTHLFPSPGISLT